MTSSNDPFSCAGFSRIPFSLQQRRETLTSPPFSDENVNNLSALADYVYAYKVEKGVQLFIEGDKTSFMCLIVSGEFNIYKQSSRSLLSAIASIGPGETIGEMALVDKHPRSVTAVAATDSIIFVITNMNFNRISDEQPKLFSWLLTKIAARICHRLRQTNDILACA